MENEEIKESNEMTTRSDGDEYDNYIQRLAKAASRYARFICPVSSNIGRKFFTNSNMNEIKHIEWDADNFTIHKANLMRQITKGGSEAGTSAWSSKIVSVNGSDVTRWFPDEEEQNYGTSDINEQFDLTTKYRCGNCGDMSAVALIFLKDKSSLDLEKIHVYPDHAFVVLNRDENSNLQDLRTWGDHCWICDPWADIVCKAADYIRRWAEKMDEWQNAHRVISCYQSNGWLHPFQWQGLIANGEKSVTYYYKVSDEDAERDVYDVETDDDLWNLIGAYEDNYDSSEEHDSDEEQEIAEDIERRQA